MLSQRRKPRNKKDLPIQEIKRMLDDGMRQSDVALFFGVSQPTISRLSAVPVQNKSLKNLKKNTCICTCCHLRPVAKGNSFLCSWCFCKAALEGDQVYC